MATAGNLVVNILGQSLKLQQELDKARSGVSRFVSFAKSALAGLAASFTFGKVMEEGFALETLETKLRVLLGSQEKAVNLMEELRQAAAKTPIGFHQTAEAAQFLLASGTKLHELTSEMKMLGDIASVSGGDLHMVANAYTQVRSAGKLQGQEMLQFINQNIPMIELLADHLGVAKNEIRGMMRDGNISFEAVRGALMQATQEGGRFAGAMDELSKTGRGALTNLISNTRVAAGEIGRYLQETLHVNAALRDVGRAMAWVGENASQVTKIALSLASALLILTQATRALTFASAVLTSVMGKGLLGAINGLLKLLGAFIAVYTTLSVAEAVFGDTTAEITELIEKEQEAARKRNDELIREMDLREKGTKVMATFREELDKIKAKELELMQGKSAAREAELVKQGLDPSVARAMTSREAKLSVTEGIMETQREIGVLTGLFDEIDLKIMDLRFAGVRDNALLTTYENELRALKAITAEKERQAEADRQYADFLKQDAQRIKSAFEEANDLLKTPADNILDKLIEFQMAGVGGELFQDAAIQLAENTGLFDPKDKEIVNQQALTAVSGMDAISAVNQFNRDMERQKAEAEKQAKRDAKAQAQRDKIIEHLKSNGVPMQKIADLLEGGDAI